MPGSPRASWETPRNCQTASHAVSRPLVRVTTCFRSRMAHPLPHHLSQGTLLRDRSQECWADENHKSDRSTRKAWFHGECLHLAPSSETAVAEAQHGERCPRATSRARRRHPVCLEIPPSAPSLTAWSSSLSPPASSVRDQVHRFSVVQRTTAHTALPWGSFAPISSSPQPSHPIQRHPSIPLDKSRPRHHASSYPPPRHPQYGC
jgi:hypothetical protein